MRCTGEGMRGRQLHQKVARICECRFQASIVAAPVDVGIRRWGLRNGRGRGAKSEELGSACGMRLDEGYRETRIRVS